MKAERNAQPVLSDFALPPVRQALLLCQRPGGQHEWLVPPEKHLDRLPPSFTVTFCVHCGTEKKDV